MTEPVAAFEDLLAPLLGTAYSLALRLTRNPADAEDLVQDAALLAFRGFGSFTPGTNFRAWFLRILTNAYFSKHRKQRREGVAVELDEAPELFLYGKAVAAGLLDRSSDPATAVMDRFDAEHVSAAIDRLPDEHRVVAALYFLDDVSYAEIAEILGLPIGTVRSRLHRARRMLQRSLWDVAAEIGLVREAPSGAIR